MIFEYIISRRIIFFFLFDILKQYIKDISNESKYIFDNRFKQLSAIFIKFSDIESSGRIKE